jgi:hypothetical protein
VYPEEDDSDVEQDAGGAERDNSELVIKTRSQARAAAASCSSGSGATPMEVDADTSRDEAYASML